jgi:hypothetical protein
MNRIIGLLIIVLILSSCGILKTTSSNKVKFKFDELNYGMPTATEEFKIQSMSPSGEHTFSSEYKLDNQTDTVIGKLGNRFGVQYILKSKVDTKVPITQIWIFPEQMINEKGESFDKLEYTIEKPTNDSRWSTYKFDKDFEIIKGQWIFQVFYGDKKLYERTFLVK